MGELKHLLLGRPVARRSPQLQQVPLVDSGLQGGSSVRRRFVASGGQGGQGRLVTEAGQEAQRLAGGGGQPSQGTHHQIGHAVGDLHRGHLRQLPGPALPLGIVFHQAPGLQVGQQLPAEQGIAPR